MYSQSGYNGKTIDSYEDFSLLVAGTEYPDAHFVRSRWTLLGA
ncbi:MAG: hypothetical protein ACKO7P_10520 [Bacteroidota bacterium]